MPTGAAQRATARAARPWGRQRRHGGRLQPRLRRERRTMGRRQTSTRVQVLQHLLRLPLSACSNRSTCDQLGLQDHLTANAGRVDSVSGELPCEAACSRLPAAARLASGFRLHAGRRLL